MKPPVIVGIGMVVVVALTGCSAPGAQSDSAYSSEPSRVVILDSGGPAPVDGTLAAVSLGSPTDEAKEALELCGANKRPNAVAGVALIPNARDVVRYGWFVGVEPEFQVEAPAWVVQFAGDVPMARGGVAHDPTCVVIDGVQTMFLTGGWTSADGKEEGRINSARPPQLALPTPLP